LYAIFCAGCPVFSCKYLVNGLAFLRKREFYAVVGLFVPNASSTSTAELCLPCGAVTPARNT
jgi:hypothetical protein